MKVKITEHAGKGAQRILPNRGAVNDIVKKRPSVNRYAKAGPNVVRNGPSIVERKP